MSDTKYSMALSRFEVAGALHITISHLTVNNKNNPLFTLMIAQLRKERDNLVALGMAELDTVREMIPRTYTDSQLSKIVPLTEEHTDANT